MRQSGSCARALCDGDALLQSGLETPHFTLHSSNFTLRIYTSHSTLHLISSHLSSPHLISALLVSSHLISSLLICHLSSSQLLNLSTVQPCSSHRSSSQFILALLHVTKLLLPQRSLLHTKIIARRTLTQPLQCDLQTLTCETQKNYAQRRRKLQLHNRISTPKRKKEDFEALFERNFTRKIARAKIEKIC